MSSNVDDEYEDPVFQWVTFTLANEVYGANVMQVQEVLRYTEVAPVPGFGFLEWQLGDVVLMEWIGLWRSSW